MPVSFDEIVFGRVNRIQKKNQALGLVVGHVSYVDI